MRLGFFWSSTTEETDQWHRLLLGDRYNRPRYDATDKSQKFPPFHYSPDAMEFYWPESALGNMRLNVRLGDAEILHYESDVRLQF
jgi:hypothetical protein